MPPYLPRFWIALSRTSAILDGSLMSCARGGFGGVSGGSFRGRPRGERSRTEGGARNVRRAIDPGKARGDPGDASSNAPSRAGRSIGGRSGGRTGRVRARVSGRGRDAHRDEPLRALPDVDPLIPSPLVLEVEVLEALDRALARAKLPDHLLRAVRDEVLERGDRLVHVPPLIVASVEPRPQRLHDQVHVLAVARRARELGEVRPARVPRVRVGALASQDLHLGQALHLVPRLLHHLLGLLGRLLEVLHRATAGEDASARPGGNRAARGGGALRAAARGALSTGGAHQRREATRRRSKQANPSGPTRAERTRRR